MLKLLGVPFDENSSFLKGPALAPNRIRKMEKDGSANRYCEMGKDIKNGAAYDDLGDIKIASFDPAYAYRTILSRVSDEIADGSKLLCFGGDHSVSFPIIEAHTAVYQQLNVLHIDAHADLYEDFEGNYYSHASPFARLMEKGKLNSLTQVGIRTFNTHQRDQAKRYGVKVVEMKDFSFDFVEELEGPLYISLDLDALDPAFAPGVSHHEPGGMSTRQLITVIQSIQAPVIGADIVEYNPTRDFNDKTAMVAYKLFKELACKMI